MKELKGINHPVRRLIFLCAGLIIMAFGVSMEVMANLVTTAGEGIVLAICKVVPI